MCVSAAQGEGPWWGQCRLDGARLGEFGGAGAVLRTFMAAPSPESRQNLLCVLLEALLPAEEGVPEGMFPPSPPPPPNYPIPLTSTPSVILSVKEKPISLMFFNSTKCSSNGTPVARLRPG